MAGRNPKIALRFLKTHQSIAASPTDKTTKRSTLKDANNIPPQPSGNGMLANRLVALQCSSDTI
jgi:hypothetical protein